MSRQVYLCYFLYYLPTAILTGLDCHFGMRAAPCHFDSALSADVEFAGHTPEGGVRHAPPPDGGYS